MGTPLATSTPIEANNTMRSELKHLRRQNSVPLDLGVTKKTKLDAEVLPPTPCDEETQLSWPSPVNSPPTPSPTVSPLQKGEDEAGCQPVEVSKRAMFLLEGNRHVKVHKFYGKLYVVIREFYQKEGNSALLPGRKGLNLDVYSGKSSNW